jgi:hypothetical protein
MSRKRAAENLSTWIKNRLEQKYGREIEDRLDMHLAIILDEAGSSALNGYFEDPSNIYACEKQLKSLARRVRLILVDTKGVTQGGSRISDGWCYSVYRMWPWTPTDTEHVLKKLASGSPL